MNPEPEILLVDDSVDIHIEEDLIKAEAQMNNYRAPEDAGRVDLILKFDNNYMAKKVFLMGFSTPILRDVALNLKKKGIKIIYWQGYRSDFEFFRKDKKNFPNTVFHHVYDDIKNIPPAGVDISDFKPVSKDIIEKMYSYESQAFSMMGRADYTDSSFVKKRNIYYQYIKFWQGMLKRYQPDAILFSDIPHGGAEYVLYALAKIFKIKTVMAELISVESRTLVVHDYKKSSVHLLEDYEKNKDKKYKIEDLSPDLQDYYLQQINAKIDSTPAYQKRALNRKTQIRTPTIKVIIRHIFHLSFLKVTAAYLKMLFTKIRVGTFDEDLLGIRYKLLIKKWERMNRSFKKEYLALQIKPDLTKKFIYVPLSSQPERITCPQSGIFDDQILMIEIIFSCLPKDWKIYVKENPNQWLSANVKSYLYRYKGYYKQISKLKNVYLIPIETSTYDLINKSQAVATVTGAAGWEAILRSKPTLVFGYIWYMYCDGVFRVSSSIKCREALNSIHKSYKVDKQKIFNYLVALDRNSIRARHFRTRDYKASNYEKGDYISHEDNVKNLAKAFYKAIF